MPPRIKLVTLWDGPLPSWFNEFSKRLAANHIISWELVHIDIKELNRLAYLVSGVKCNKATPYSLCDLRPLFGEMFEPIYRGYEWWGWCDLDIVLGDLNSLLPPLLDTCDVISIEEYGVSGPFTILKNTPATTSLWRSEDYEEVLTDPEYCNFDEVGFAPPGFINYNPNFTRAVRSSGLRYIFDNRSWAESHHQLPSGGPSRCCELSGNKLLEIPTGRELLLYHFTTKQWPIPNRYHSLLEDQTNYLPIVENRLAHPSLPNHITETPEYWSSRVTKVLANPATPTYKTVLDTTSNGWDKVQSHSKEILAKYTKPGESILDAGCGYGAIIPITTKLKLQYHGVDYCRDMIDLALAANIGIPFTLASLDNLPFSNHQFDWAFCRGVEGSTKTLVSNKKWRAIQRELLRVARKLILVDSSMNHRVIEG